MSTDQILLVVFATCFLAAATVVVATSVDAAWRWWVMRRWAKRHGLKRLGSGAPAVTLLARRILPDLDARTSNTLNAAQGPWRGHTVTVFDIRMKRYIDLLRVWSGDMDKTGTVLCVELPADVPTVSVRPKAGCFLDVSRPVGRCVEMESAQFNDDFHVAAADGREAFHLVTPRVMQVVMDHPNTAFEFVGHRVAAWRPRRMNIDQIETHLAALLAIVAVIPDYVFASDLPTAEATHGP